MEITTYRIKTIRLTCCVLWGRGASSAVCGAMRRGKSEAGVTMSRRKMTKKKDWPAAGLMVKWCLLCSLWGNEEGEERGGRNHVPEEDGAQAQSHQLRASPYNKKNLCYQCLFSVCTLPVTSVSDPDPNPGKPNQGSMGIRIRIGNADPDPGPRIFTRKEIYQI